MLELFAKVLKYTTPTYENYRDIMQFLGCWNDLECEDKENFIEYPEVMTIERLVKTRLGLITKDEIDEHVDNYLASQGLT